jgi:phosphoribosylaminoimidazolecarboxamide formyltransferase/IMP cyclohydrolase
MREGAISGYLSARDSSGTRDAYPLYLTLPFERVYGLRYGENPHQSGAFYRDRRAPDGSLALAESVGAGGKELSFNNIVDADAAFGAAREFDRPAAVIVKHTNPCGVALAADLSTAYKTAREADPVSAFGGGRSQSVGGGRHPKIIAETFVECVVAPSFSAERSERCAARKPAGLDPRGCPPMRRARVQG